MEAGYDYMLFRGRVQRRLARFGGISLLVLGLLLLASGGASYLYSAMARSNLDDMRVVVEYPEPTTVPRPTPVPPPREVPAFSSSNIATTTLYPGEAVSVDSWTDLLGYEPLPLREQGLLEGFSPIGPGDPALLESVAPATRIIVPAIGVDSAVRQLSVFDLGNSRAYETPKNIVGHIPESDDAGELGDSWYFGHTESPIRGEGSVFFTLQRVPELLKNGEDVYIVTDNGSERFLYRAIETEVFHQDELSLTDSGEARIHLVSCVPRLVYDHRLVVTGELIAKQ